jgi:hypothetical protein
MIRLTSGKVPTTAIGLELFSKKVIWYSQLTNHSQYAQIKHEPSVRIPVEAEPELHSRYILILISI